MASNGALGVIKCDIKCDYNEKALKHSVAENTIKIIYDHRNDGEDGSSWRSATKFKYGRFTARIKCPIGNTAGLVSAFYLTSEEFEDRDKRPRIHDEIDIEFVGNKQKVETDYYIKGKGKGGKEGKHDLKEFDTSSEFHEYSIDWQRDKIEWFIDGKSLRVADRSQGIPIPEQSMYLCGSFWNGTKNHSGWCGTYKGTDKPYTLVMKDVRVS